MTAPATGGTRPFPTDRLRVVALGIVLLGLGFGTIRLVTQFDYGYDFSVYRAAGSAVLHHHSLLGPWIGERVPHALPFTYPPLAAVVAVPLALVGDIGYISNQSLNGVLVRAFGPHEQVVWLLTAAVVVGFGLGRATVASRRGQELLGISLVALAGVLASPVSWIHHLVWVVPALAVLVDDGTSRRRVTIAASAAALFTLRLPYLARSIPAGWHLGWIAAVLSDSDALVCVALLIVLARVVSPNFRYPNFRYPNFRYGATRSNVRTRP